jgi:phage/conjugal plasmid C-4 type zinc finger TraR family protein
MAQEKVFTSGNDIYITNVLHQEQIMAGGWTRDGAVQDQIDASVDDAVQLARSRLPTGDSATHCQECGELIPLPRRKAVPGVRFCIECQTQIDEENEAGATGINRRASKDSQLR